MSNTGPLPPTGGDNRNLGPILLGINWMVFGLAMIIVCLRLGTRIWITRNFGWDDFTILLTQVVNCCGMGFVMTEVSYGLGRHYRYLSPYQYAHYLKFDYLDWIQVFVTLALSKISICQFLLRLSKFDRLRRFLQGFIVLIILTHLPLTLLMIFQCHPVQKYWNQTLPGSCFRKDTVEKIVISQGVISIVTDFIGALFPVFLIWNVDIRFRSKVGLCLLMGLGIFTAAACIVRTALSWEIKSDDITWVGVGNAIARMFEINCGIIASCIPLMKPLIRYIKIRIWGAESSERLTSDENLSKQTHWFPQLWNNRGHLQSSHGANEPEDFDAYVRYTKERHRKRRPPNNAILAVSNPVMDTVPGRPPSLIVQPNVNLPLHGVPEVSGTNRYSTVDPIQELKGIVANHKFDEEMGR